MEQRVYEKIFSSAGEGILVVQHGKWCLCNPALLDIFELKEGDSSFVSKNIHQFLHPEDLDLVLERHLSRLSGKTPPKNYEFRIVTRNRNIKWVALNVERFLWDEKPATLCFISDITKRVESENRLRDREERYRRQSEYLTALHETALGLMDRLRTEGLIHSILEKVSFLAGAKHGYVFILNPESKSMILADGMGDAKNMEGYTAMFGKGLVGRIWKSGKTLYVKDYKTWPHRFSGEYLDRIHSIAGVPLITGGKVKGVIGLAFEKHEKTLTGEDLHDLERFARLAALALHNAGLYTDSQHSLSEKTAAEIALKKANEELEFRVMVRTAELTRANEALKQEIAERKKAEVSLTKREKQLEDQSQHLSEMNAALKVLLRQRENDRKDLEESVLSNVSNLVLPCIDRLKAGNILDPKRKTLEQLEKNIQRIVTPFIRKISSRSMNLTPTEIKVAELTRDGCATKEIAARLLLSENTVVFHRYNLRTKLGIKGQKINLRSHLLSFEE